MKKIDPQVFLPMPVVLVGTVLDKRVNFMTVGWACRVNYEPPMIAVAINHSHHTVAGLRQNKAFSVCLPSEALLEKADCAGMNSGRTKDKSKLFDVFYGDSQHAPLIRDCPLNLECKLVKEVELPNDWLFVGEISSAWADESKLIEGRPDFARMGLYTLTMPDNQYWHWGEKAAKAFSASCELPRS